MTFLFVLSSLATYRLALMFSKEAGPGRIFQKLRKLPPPKSSAREGLSCLFCESIYFAAIITAYLVIIDQVPLWLSPLWWLGSSAVAVICNQEWSKGDL